MSNGAGVNDSLQVLNGLRALVVDDDQDSLELIAFFLEQYSVQVMTAGFSQSSSRSDSTI